MADVVLDETPWNVADERGGWGQEVRNLASGAAHAGAGGLSHDCHGSRIATKPRPTKRFTWRTPDPKSPAAAPWDFHRKAVNVRN